MNAEKVPQAPAGFGTRYLQTWIMSFTLIVGFSMRTTISVALVAMTDAKHANPDFRDYDWSAQEKSLILSSFLWGYTISQIPSGYLAGIWSARKLFSIGLFLSGVVHLLTPLLADRGGWMAVCASRVLMGLLQACFLSCMHTLVAKWAPPQERSRMSTYISSGASLGNVVAMMVTGYIAGSPLGWPGIYYIFGSLTIFMSVVFYLNVFDSPSEHPRISEEEKSYITESIWREHRAHETLSVPWKAICTSLPMWAIILAHCGNNWGSWTLQTEIPDYVKKILKFEIGEVGVISSLFFIACWAASFPCSWLADYAISHGISVSWTRRIFNSIGMYLAAACFILLCSVDHLSKAWPVALLIVAGTAKAGLTSAFNVNHIDLSPNFAGNLYAISNCVATLVSIVAPILCGAIVGDSTDPGPWHSVFYITAGIYIVTNTFYVIFARGKIQSWNSPESAEARRQSIVSSVYEPNTYTIDL